VQGDGADEQIAAAIRIANRYAMGDVLIVGRGGGSLEDLLAFSSEVVVRAIAESGIPVIAAVGHETDVTLADFAADVRAPTPSAAAEIVASSRVELLSRVRGVRTDIESGIRQRLERVRMLLTHFAADNLERNVRIYLQPLSQRADIAREGLLQGFKDVTISRRHRLELASRELASYSPLAILARGYAVVTHERTGHVLLDSDAVQRGDSVSIRLARGGMKATVEEKHAGEK
jgi:exodeoxyribonuclease VII large subunit